MKNHNSRLAQLETKAGKAQRPTWRGLVDGTYQPDPEEWRAFIIEKLDAAVNGDTQICASQPLSPEAAELLRRLDAIAKANEHGKV